MQMIITEPSCIKSDYCWDAVLSHSHIQKKSIEEEQLLWNRYLNFRHYIPNKRSGFD